ncbi:helix-turn-helix transcriptional regulator [Pasteurella multocida subsp. multocida]|uniref:Helix-turn-helix transcriptional regulator n=1 Tax=Pasteurella multocida TaxID=747 RepID=A0A9X3UPE2_PASMD|nr:helix-turn-helix transcriptional regulator [Pasteurella multocida]MBF6979990.1 helix-turn-helix transcriptional regulator [Pasteurella multocida]MDA5608957.1 helix-turn-helix transcriptional regulator [Pasteurella multocida subsp. multocida]MDA5611698.1 helix-turn-helix transcriptional regulator [Pasteurella multocida]MDA5614184.1 helix-turn-helix transcriptional regulator [Pasteurella multocida]MDA5616478.1 helix-turn-helix transcriptional regulator [Pasteurella multocida]
MSDLATRLQALLEEKRLSKNAFAKMVGVSQPAISDIINGKTRDPKNILEIATALGVDPNWLKTGEGSRDTSLIVSEPNAEHKVKVDHLSVSAIAGYNGFSNEDYPDIIRSIYFSENGLLEIVGKKTTQGLYLISVPTDSMSPTINKGDIVFVDVNVNAYVGEGVYVFDLNGETYIKRLQRIPTGVIRALSDNPLYPPFDITEKLFNTAVVRGKFIRVLPINPKDL